MPDRANLSDYRLCVRLDAPLDRRWVAPDDSAFLRHEVELVRFDEAVDDFVPVCTAIVFRVRWVPGWDLEDAADAEGDSPLLEEVCLDALDATGGPAERFAVVFPGVAASVVVDRIEFAHPREEDAVVQGLLIRGIFDLIGRAGDLFFLPDDGQDGRLWQRAVGAVRVGRFVVASADAHRPHFPLAVLPEGVAEA